MSLHRRSLGRGRWVATISAILIVVGCALPWFRAGGAEGIPALEGNGFFGPGILAFLAALATLALVTLPYAMGDRPVAVDRWWVYAALAMIAALGLLLRSVGIALDSGGFGTMLPDRAPGVWLAAAGVVGLAFATAELYGARPE
ncbi:MAG TPA: hypothetical protein VIK16_05405 [Candidatus Limnocylindrales bacterium]|jgi:hypothetical protein